MVPETKEVFRGKEDLECFLVKTDLNIHELIEQGVLWKVDKVKESKAEVLKVCSHLRAKCRTVNTEKFAIDVYRHMGADNMIIDVDPLTWELHGDIDQKALDYIKMTGETVKSLIECKTFTKICTKVVERKVKQQSYQRYKHRDSGLYFYSIVNST